MIADAAELHRPIVASDRTFWNVYRFDQIAQNITDRIDNPAESGVERYVGLEHLDPESLQIRRWGAPTDVEATKLRFQPGDIIFGKRRAYQRKLAVADFAGICSAHALVLRARPNVVDPEFLPFFMQSDVFFERALAISVGSLSPTINWRTLAAQEFALPPLEEQRRIASILQTADECIARLEMVVDKLQDFREAFRNSAFESGPHSNDWEVRKLDELFSVQLGKMASPKSRLGISPTPYLANYNVQWDWLNLEKVQTMDFNERERAKFELKSGDLLVCEGGESGRTAIWSADIPGCCYQKALHRLRSLDGELEPELMLEFMMFAANSGQLHKLTGHSTIAHLTAERLRTLSVLVPPRAVQSQLLRAFRAAKLQTQEAVAHLEAVRCLKKRLIKASLDRS